MEETMNRPLLLEQLAYGEEGKEDKMQDYDAGVPVGPPRLPSSLSIAGPHVIGKEEMYFKDLTPSSAPFVRDRTSLKRLNVTVKYLTRMDARTTSWPDLPLQLEELYIRNACVDHLRCLARMPRLRSLAVVHYQGDIFVSLDPVEPRGRSGVQWLGVELLLDYPLLIVLVRAHAASLRTLEIRCNPRDYADLRQDLAGSGLRCLRRLVLVRGHHSSADTNCDRQLRGIQTALPYVQVLCSQCNSHQYHGEIWWW